MNEETPVCPLTKLPNDILTLIIGLLNLKDICALRGLSSRFFGLTNTILGKHLRIKQIVSNNKGYLFLLENGSVYAYGSNEGCALGLPASESNIEQPIQIPALRGIKSIVLTNNLGIAITKNNEFLEWGERTNSGYERSDKLHLPKKLGLKNIIKVSAGLTDTLALCEDGAVYTCDESLYPRTRQRIPELHSISDIAVGSGQLLACSHEGQLFAWGHNLHGQTGLQDPGDYIARPTLIPSLEKVRRVYANKFVSAALTHDNRIFIWGYVGDLFGLENLIVRSPREVIHKLDKIEDVLISPIMIVLSITGGDIWTSIESDTNKISTSDTKPVLSVIPEFKNGMVIELSQDRTILLNQKTGQIHTNDPRVNRLNLDLIFTAYLKLRNEPRSQDWSLSIEEKKYLTNVLDHFIKYHKSLILADSKEVMNAKALRSYIIARSNFLDIKPEVMAHQKVNLHQLKNTNWNSCLNRLAQVLQQLKFQHILSLANIENDRNCLVRKAEKG